MARPLHDTNLRDTGRAEDVFALYHGLLAVPTGDAPGCVEAAGVLIEIEAERDLNVLGRHCEAMGGVPGVRF